MNKILITGCMVLTAFAAIAMPNKKELAKAQRLVEDVTSADLKALKAGKLTTKEVANNHMALAAKAENDAQRYLLLQGAFKLFARCEEYDAAAEALAVMNRDIDSISPDLIVEIVSKEMRRVAGEKAPKVLAIFKSAKRLVRYRAELSKFEKELARKPNDPLLNLKCGECLAELGHWPRALKMFAKADGEVAKIAKAEMGEKSDPLKVADYWWDYGNPDDGITQYKYHAIKFYQLALGNPQFDGLRRQQAEQRIAEVKEDGFEFRSYSICDGDIVKVSGGQLTVTLPENETIEFVKIKPGRFPMLIDADGNTRMTTITRPYWIGKYALTLGQWHALMGDVLVSGEYDWRKDKTVDRQQAVMDKLGHNIAIARSALQASEFAAKLTNLLKAQIPEGYVVRLPTYAEWEYAVRGDNRDMYADLIEFKTNPSKFNDLRVKLNGGKSKQKADEDKFKKSGLDCSWNYFVGRSTNSRGICDFFREPEATLDRINVEHIFDSRDGKSGKEKGNAPCKMWPLPDGNVDPFQYTDAAISHACVLKRGVMGTMMYVNDMWAQTTVRVVIGPDYVGEWMKRSKDAQDGDVKVKVLNHVDRQRVKAKQRIEKDREVYSDAERAKIEKLYQQFTNTLDLAIVQTLIDKYPRSNRTGCAVCSAASNRPGNIRVKLLRAAIEQFGDCYYENGMSVGAAARAQFAHRLASTGQKDEARKLWREIVEKYPDAIMGGGTKFISIMPDYAK